MTQIRFMGYFSAQRLRTGHPRWSGDSNPHIRPTRLIQFPIYLLRRTLRSPNILAGSFGHTRQNVSAMPKKPYSHLVRTALASVLAVTAMCAAAQTETLQTKQAISLRDQPATTATTLASLPAGTSVTRLPQRNGPWMQVQTGTGQVGWVHMFELTASKASAPASNGLTGALRGLSGFLNRGSSSGGTTVATSTVGIRGLSKEDIQNAAPNTAAVERLEQFRVDDTQARRYASERSLQAQAVTPLPAPAEPAAPNTNGGYNK